MKPATGLKLGGRVSARAAVIVAGILATVFGLSACQRDTPGKVETITVGMEATAVNSLIYIAEVRDYFAANGLKVVIKDYASGLAAANGMLNGEVDIATASEFVIVGTVLAREKISTLASIDKFWHIYLIARKAPGIENIADLKGKRIGVPLKTAAEFYLGRFLDLQGMSVNLVTLINVGPSQSVNALTNGDVDAVIAWRPNVNAIEDRLGSGTAKWPAQSGQAAYCVLVGTDSWVKKAPARVNRFLKSLARAEDYLVRHPEEARAIVQKKARYDDAYMGTVWPEHQLSLSLDQSFITAMEDEARWMIQSGLTTEKQVPDFLEYIYMNGLEAVKPEAVRIIR
jgi:NitT/TauT family transport system substrate-binding protein